MTHTYAALSPEQYAEVSSQFLIDSWSYSKVTTFSRNEKAFEMGSICGIHGRSSATTVAGKAYHAALDFYFSQRKLNIEADIVELELVGFALIDEVDGNKWKIQKTTPSINDCKIKAYSLTSALLRNFFSEIGTYIDEIDEIIEVEVKCSEFVTVNGVDIPLPCHAVIDLVFKSKAGKTVVLDHKSKTAFSKDDEVSMSLGVQGITYVIVYEARTGITIDEVWFVENKHSQNKDKSAQLQAFKVEITDNVRKIYEALLYEPLKRMIAAVNDPNYVYLINDSDNFVDKAELYEFWCRTQIQEVEDFNVSDAKKELVAKRLKKIRDASISTISPNVIKEFKKNAASFIQYDLSNKNMTNQEKIEHVLRSFGTIVRVAHTFEGYSSNSFLLEISAGVKISSIHSHKLDIANALDVSTVRISKDLMVHENKSYLVIEFSKKRTEDLLYNADHLVGMKIPIGKDNFGNTVVWDLDNHSTPHALVCGATGSGKSVMVRSTIEYAIAAGVRQILIFDPKYEFLPFKTMEGCVVINEIENIEGAMSALVEEMNDRVMKGQNSKTLVIFDEFADAMAQSSKGKSLRGTKSLEENLRILLQKGRSSGFRVMAATQRASVKVITGDAKVNFPVQICFRVPKEVDSKVVIDEAGAEALSGMGDGLMKSPQYPDVQRFQAYYTP